MAFSSSTVSIGATTKKADYDRLLDNTKALKDEAITLKGTKTFNSGTVFVIKPKVDGIETRSGTGSVGISCQYLSSSGNSVVNFKTKIVEIGDWDMDANVAPNGGPNAGIIDLAMDETKLRTIEIMIRNDADSLRYNVPTFGGDILTSTVYPAWASFILTKNNILSEGVYLVRLSGSTFDTTDYNATGYNRGWVTIGYED